MANEQVCISVYALVIIIILIVYLHKNKSPMCNKDGLAKGFNLDLPIQSSSYRLLS